jgi:hypothetical protein
MEWPGLAPGHLHFQASLTSPRRLDVELARQNEAMAGTG